MLTPTQAQTLKAYILADPVLSTFPHTQDGAYAIAEALKATAAPEYVVWRTNVPAGEIGNAWSGADIDGMSALNMQRLQLLLASSPQGVFDMSRLDRRTGFLNPFGASGSNPSRVAMLIVFKRSATVLEKLFASGAGTSANPSTMVVEGALDYNEVYSIIVG